MKLLLFKINEEIITKQTNTDIPEIISLLKTEFHKGNLFVYDFETEELFKIKDLYFTGKAIKSGFELSALFFKQKYKDFYEIFQIETNFKFNEIDYENRLNFAKSVSYNKSLMDTYKYSLSPEDMVDAMNYVKLKDKEFLNFILYSFAKEKAVVIGYPKTLVNKIFLLLNEFKQNHPGKFLSEWSSEFFGTRQNPFDSHWNENKNFDFFMNYCINKFKRK